MKLSGEGAAPSSKSEDVDAEMHCMDDLIMYDVYTTMHGSLARPS